MIPLRSFIIALATIWLAAKPASAEETYVLTPPKSADVGEHVRISNELSDDTDFSLLDADGKVVQSKSEKTIRTSVYVQTVLAKEKNKNPSKLSVTFEKASMTKDGSDAEVGLAGKTIIIERQGKSNTFRYEDGTEPAQGPLEFLNKQFKAGGESDASWDIAFFPKAPVKIEETWSADLEEAARQLADRETPVHFDLSKSKGTCRLLKVYKKEGRTFAVISVDAELALQDVGAAPNVIKFSPGSVFTFKGTIEKCTSGGPDLCTNSLRMAMYATAKQAVPGDKELTLKMKANGTETESHETIPAK